MNPMIGAPQSVDADVAAVVRLIKRTRGSDEARRFQHQFDHVHRLQLEHRRLWRLRPLLDI